MINWFCKDILDDPICKECPHRLVIEDEPDIPYPCDLENYPADCCIKNDIKKGRDKTRP